MKDIDLTKVNPKPPKWMKKRRDREAFGGGVDYAGDQLYDAFRRAKTEGEREAALDRLLGEGQSAAYDIARCGDGDAEVTADLVYEGIVAFVKAVKLALA